MRQPNEARQGAEDRGPVGVTEVHGPSAAASWLLENGEAIRSYNEHIEAHGVFSEGLRPF